MAHARTLLLPLLLLWLAGCDCGSDGSHDADGDADADADADTDADTDADGDGDADADADADADGDGDADPCAGSDALTVAVVVQGTSWLLDEPAPMEGVDVALDCGTERRTGQTDAAGQVVFEGLALATTPVDVTAHHPDTDAVTVLGVGSAAEPLAVGLTHRPPFDLLQLAGVSVPTQADSLDLVSVPGGGVGSYERDEYLISFFPRALERLVAIEYVVGDGDVATPIARFDTTFPPPAAGDPGPDVEYAAAAFETTTLLVRALDPLLDARARPSDDGVHRHWDRGQLGAVVHDVDGADGSWTVLGFTTDVEATGDTDTLHVAWSADAVLGQLRTQVRVGDSELRAGAVATRDGAPDAMGDLEVPTLPVFEGGPDAIVLGAGDLEVRRPDWAVGELLVRIEPLAGGEPLFGQDLPSWTVRIPEGVTTFHLPAPPADRTTADVLGPSDLRVVLLATNGVSPAAGVHWMAFDAHRTATAAE